MNCRRRESINRGSSRTDIHRSLRYVTLRYGRRFEESDGSPERTRRGRDWLRRRVDRPRRRHIWRTRRGPPRSRGRGRSRLPSRTPPGPRRGGRSPAFRKRSTWGEWGWEWVGGESVAKSVGEHSLENKKNASRPKNESGRNRSDQIGRVGWSHSLRWRMSTESRFTTTNAASGIVTHLGLALPWILNYSKPSWDIQRTAQRFKSIARASRVRRAGETHRVDAFRKDEWARALNASQRAAASTLGTGAGRGTARRLGGGETSKTSTHACMKFRTAGKTRQLCELPKHD